MFQNLSNATVIISDTCDRSSFFPKTGPDIPEIASQIAAANKADLGQTYPPSNPKHYWGMPPACGQINVNVAVPQSNTKYGGLGPKSGVRKNPPVRRRAVFSRRQGMLSPLFYASSCSF